MKKNSNIRKLLFETTSIVFAVLLALILNSWRESVSVNNRLKKVKEVIVAEILRNDSLLQASISYRKELLNSLYNNKHLISSVPIDQLPFNANDNRQLEIFFQKGILFEQKKYFSKVEVVQLDNQKVLVLDNNVFDLVVEDDSLKLFGIGNIQLKLPYLNNQSWQIIQSTELVSELDIILVKQLSIVNTLILTYTTTGEKAIDCIYDGNQECIVSALEDLYSIENRIAKENSLVLKMLAE